MIYQGLTRELISGAHLLTYNDSSARKFEFWRKVTTKVEVVEGEGLTTYTYGPDISILTGKGSLRKDSTLDVFEEKIQKHLETEENVIRIVEGKVWTPLSRSIVISCEHRRSDGKSQGCDCTKKGDTNVDLVVSKRCAVLHENYRLGFYCGQNFGGRFYPAIFKTLVGPALNYWFK